MTLEMVEASITGRREDAEALVNAQMPPGWPQRELVERAFAGALDALGLDPAAGRARLWGNRVIVLPAEGGRRVVGSVVFHGPPGSDGIAEIAYGVEESSQRKGYATEAVAACVAWALGEQGVHAVQAVTFRWHLASLRVIEKVGMVPVGARDHETMGELIVFERRRE
jgi:RimJ/RimL family protein N-acetyltransferase